MVQGGAHGRRERPRRACTEVIAPAPAFHVKNGNRLLVSEGMNLGTPAGGGTERSRV